MTRDQLIQAQIRTLELVFDFLFFILPFFSRLAKSQGFDDVDKEATTCRLHAHIHTQNMIKNTIKRAFKKQIEYSLTNVGMSSSGCLVAVRCTKIMDE